MSNFVKMLLITHIQKLIVNNFEAGQKKCQLLIFKIIQKSSCPPPLCRLRVQSPSDAPPLTFQDVTVVFEICPMKLSTQHI